MSGMRDGKKNKKECFKSKLNPGPSGKGEVTVDHHHPSIASGRHLRGQDDND